MAPIHIGSGSFYTQKEYIYENNQYIFPDKVQLYQEIAKLGPKYQEKFEKFYWKILVTTLVSHV